LCLEAIEGFSLNSNDKKMKIGLLGTRGIPNKYGGFEEFAEKVTEHWVNEGHEVIVYCESIHKGYDDVLPNGVKRVFIKTFQKRLRGFYLFLYDYQSTKDALRQKCDVIYHAGYQSAALGNLLLKKKLTGRLIYNMDGLEWKRSKWSKLVQVITKHFEKLAATSGALLVADNKGIQEYLNSEYNVTSELISYGADKVENPNPECLREFDLTSKLYNILVARFEPENNLESIISAHIAAKQHLVVIANNSTAHYLELLPMMSSSEFITFIGPIYNKETLNSLRAFAKFYFHGHTVGGTNPSLLEAMACKCSILAHDNPFNRDVLKGNGFFWKDSEAIVSMLLNPSNLEFDAKKQLEYLELNYSWKQVALDHIKLFNTLKV
jgi:glycosyltransferase involved in cell wall biosynthesis